MQPVDQLGLATERTALAGERTRLANERTFSAWMRMGLASVGGGVAIIRVLTFQTQTHHFIAQCIGGVLILLGASIFTLAYWDYRTTQRKLQLQTGYAGSVWAITGIVIALLIISLLLFLISFSGSWN